MACPSCSVESHSTCTKPIESSCCCHETSQKEEKSIWVGSTETSNGTKPDDDDGFEPRRGKKSSTKRRFRASRGDRGLKDQQSTGRKRAAQLFPLDRTAPCEWRGLRRAGGGKTPITGCLKGLQEARHHGPDKNTLNNDEGNVHRICHKCHNRWHTVNDPDYQWDDHHEPHNPNGPVATMDELIENEMYWVGIKLVKVVD